MDSDVVFARGRDAADKGNYDYAITVFREVLRFAPDHLKARVALRGCELARFQEKGGGLAGSIRGHLTGLVAFLMMHLPGSANGRIERCEDFLQHVPMSAYGLKKLAGACKAAGHVEAAVNTLEFVRQRKPDNVGVLRMLADLYAEKEDFTRAVRCYEELARLRPNDRVVTDGLRNLSAAEHMQQTKLDETDSYRDQIRDSEKARKLEEEQHIVRSVDDADAAIERLQAELREEPNSVEKLLKLGDVYQLKEDFKFALAAYRKALEVEPRYDVRARIGDLQIKLLKREELAALEAAKAASADAALKQRAAEVRQQRIELAIREFEKRQREHPTETPLAHHLGMLYYEEGSEASIAKAVACFQKSVDDPKHKPRARFMLGQCFARNPKTHDMAIGQFKQALELQMSPSGEMAKSIQYNLGLLNEQGGDMGEAVEWYKKVFGIDAGFRDVRKKIEELS